MILTICMGGVDHTAVESTICPAWFCLEGDHQRFRGLLNFRIKSSTVGGFWAAAGFGVGGAFGPAVGVGLGLAGAFIDWAGGALSERRERLIRPR